MALLGAGLAGVAAHDEPAPVVFGRIGGDRAPGTTAPVPTTADAATPGTPATTAATGGRSIRGMLPRLQAFVSEQRGLAFKAPVNVELLGDAEFRRRIQNTGDDDRRELGEAQAVLQAMGLLKPGVDLVGVIERFSAEAILGFYDPETEELVVRGTSADPFVRTVLVHELTHALEDQHFDLERDELGDEAALGFEALVEGSALRIEDRYRATLSEDERKAADRAERELGTGVPDDVPEVIQFAFGFPYAYGPQLVRVLLRNGGQARLDAAYADPPASAEHVLHPDRYLRGDRPRSVPVPDADRAAFDDGEVGELFLILMLQAELDDDVALDASAGWGGDRYVAWRDGRRTCVRMRFAMDTRRDTAELSAALRDWAAERDGNASAEATTLTTCG